MIFRVRLKCVSNCQTHQTFPPFPDSLDDICPFSGPLLSLSLSLPLSFSLSLSLSLSIKKKKVLLLYKLYKVLLYEPCVKGMSARLWSA